MNVELHAIVKGRVQGVGFRYTTLRCAEILEIKGTVRNLTNGSVEIYAQGSEEVLEKFLAKLQNEKFPKEIDTIESQYRTPQATFTNFTIIK